MDAVEVILILAFGYFYSLFGDVAAESCVFFNASDLSNQMLVIKDYIKDDEYCFISQSAVGEAVPCAFNATATLLSITLLMLRTQEELNKTFLLEYGKGRVGRSISSNTTVCPATTDAANATVQRSHAAACIAGVLALVIIIAVIVAVWMYIKWRGRSASKYTTANTKNKDEADISSSNSTDSGLTT